MRPLLLVALLALSGCPTTDGDDFPGQLVFVTVEPLFDNCTPQRMTGDAGVQWLGQRPDGGLALTILDEVKYGPERDGGLLAGISREQIPPLDDGNVHFGDGGTECIAETRWERFDGGLNLMQGLPGIETCPSAPAYLPEQSCSVARRFVLAPIRECSQRCVRLSNDGAACDC